MSILCTFDGEGVREPYSNTGSAIAGGDVVVLASGSSGRIGIAINAIPATTGTGNLEVRRKWNMPKKTGVVFTHGQKVYWDPSAKTITGTFTSALTYAGRVVGNYASAATVATVNINVP